MEKEGTAPGPEGVVKPCLFSSDSLRHRYPSQNKKAYSETVGTDFRHCFRIGA